MKIKLQQSRSLIPFNVKHFETDLCMNCLILTLRVYNPLPMQPVGDQDVASNCWVFSFLFCKLSYVLTQKNQIRLQLFRPQKKKKNPFDVFTIKDETPLVCK